MFQNFLFLLRLNGLDSLSRLLYPNTNEMFQFTKILHFGSVREGCHYLLPQIFAVCGDDNSIDENENKAHTRSFLKLENTRISHQRLEIK